VKPLLLIFGLVGLLAVRAQPANPVVITNGAGIFYSNYGGMAFTDAEGNYVFVGGRQGFVEIFYHDGTHLTFPYEPISMSFSGADTHGTFTAFVHETLVTTRRGGGGGRGDGYPGLRTAVGGGSIEYQYDRPPGERSAAPLLQVLRLNRGANSVVNSVELALNGDKRTSDDPALGRQRHKYWIETSTDLVIWLRYGGPGAAYFAGALTVSLDSSTNAPRQTYFRSGDAGLFAAP